MPAFHRIEDVLLSQGDGESAEHFSERAVASSSKAFAGCAPHCRTSDTSLSKFPTLYLAMLIQGSCSLQIETTVRRKQVLFMDNSDHPALPRKDHVWVMQAIRTRVLPAQYDIDME